MEERIIDDEYGKGVRLKKTKDGYVLADELERGEELLDNTDETEEGEEVSFEFPTFEAEEGDDDLIGLSPEEVKKRLAERARLEAERQAEYEKLCKEGEEFLQSNEYEKASASFKKAREFSDEPTQASVGYWSAKTEKFTKPNVFLEAYEEAGVESLAYDLGEEGVQILKENYREVFQREYDALVEEEAPLKEAFEGKQQKRRGYLKARLKKSSLLFGVSLLPLVVFTVLTIVYFGLIRSTPNWVHLTPTIVFGVLSVASFIAFVVLMNGFFNSLRLYTKNERVDGTDEGARLVQIGLYKEIYEFFLNDDKESREETV